MAGLIFVGWASILYWQNSIWPYRLTVRTRGSHPRNRGSIPRGAANKKSDHPVGFFVCTPAKGNRSIEDLFGSLNFHKQTLN